MHPIPKGLILAASSSNSGKTTLSLAIQRLLKRKKFDVVPAKCGPDYIDPAFHKVATGKESINLDPWAMGKDDILRRYAMHAGDADLTFVEGVMGLFDGAAKSRGSTASLARILGLPIILVLDVKGQAQTAAAIAQGLRSFDPALNVAGVILNRVGSTAHEMLLRCAFKDIDLPVLGAVRVSQDLELPSRHLGLVQATEYDELSDKIDKIADHVDQFIDLDQLLNVAEPGYVFASTEQKRRLKPLGQTIAIARDAAFTFIYPHILNDWKEQGSKLSFFSPLANETPAPEADAVYLPGGYPELHLDELENAVNFKSSMQSMTDQGKLIFAECGGYMVLGRSIVSSSSSEHQMLNLLPLVTSFSKPKLNLGYRKLTHQSDLPFSGSIAAHEFHYATVEWQGATDPLFKATNAAGKEMGTMGQRIGSVHGSFAHLIAPLIG